MFKKLALAGIVVCALLLCLVVNGRPLSARSQQQQPAASDSQTALDRDLKMLREDIRSKKKQLIAANLKITDEEATKFWPVYDRYTAELVKTNDEKYALIKQYVEQWGTMTDAQATDLTKRALNVDQNVANLRIRYIPEFAKVLPGKKSATFFQIERRVQAMIDLQLSSQLPLVQAQE